MVLATAPEMRLTWLPSESALMTAVFVLPTPVHDDSGVAHVAEHLVFRGSDTFPAHHNLFALQSLLPVKVNASTQPGFSFFYLQSAFPDVFCLVFAWLQAGLLQQSYSDDVISREKDGVIARELLFYARDPAFERAAAQLYYCGGRLPSLLALSSERVRDYKRCYYRAGAIQCLLSTPERPSEQWARGDYQTPLRDVASGKQPAEVQRLLRYASIASANVWSTTDVTLPNEEVVVLPPMPSLSISSQHTRPLAGLTAALPRYCAWQHSDRVPQYVREHLWPKHAEQLHITDEGDWCYRAHLSAAQQQAAMAWVQREACWYPRLAGQCYTQGVVMENDEIVLYGISDAYASQRHTYVDRFYKFL